MAIDRSAPAVAISELVIDASPDIVWDVLTDIDDWPGWNHGVKSVALAGPLAPGTTFQWKAGMATITSTLRRVEPPALIAWTGRTLGIRAIHVHRLSPHGSATAVTSEESWDGPVVRLLRRRMTRTLRSALETGLERLKAEVERQAAA